jgi:hypothetical protein
VDNPYPASKTWDFAVNRLISLGNRALHNPSKLDRCGLRSALLAWRPNGWSGQVRGNETMHLRAEMEANRVDYVFFRRRYEEV